jgi:hypothetical protein
MVILFYSVGKLNLYTAHIKVTAKNYFLTLIKNYSFFWQAFCNLEEKINN